MSDLRTKSLSGIQLYVRDNTWDEGIASEVIVGDAYKVSAWRPPTKSPVIFDVGGHIGSFSVWMAARFPSAKIYTFEMDASNQAVLEKNVEGRKNVTVVKAALGDRTGTVARDTVQKLNTGGAGVFWDRTEGVMVPAKSAADFVTENGIKWIDLLKLDCEGSEFSIVEDLSRLSGGLKSIVGQIAAEIHDPVDSPRATALLKTLSENYTWVTSRPSKSPGTWTLWASNVEDTVAQRVSVVLGVPVYNRYDLLPRLISSALGGTRQPDRIVVVDNGGRFDSDYNGPLDWVEVIRPRKNLGCAGGWNAVFRSSLSSDIVVMSNDDVVMRPDAVERYVRAIEENAERDVIVTDHTVEHYKWSLYGMKTSLWKRIGVFDERFWPAYFEDDDYERRLTLAGVPNVHVEGILSHFGSATIAAYNDPGKKMHHVQFEENKSRYVQKWGGMPGKETSDVPFEAPVLSPFFFPFGPRRR